MLAWEFGNYLGHVGKLVPLLKELKRRGHQCSLVAKNLASVYQFLSPGEAKVFQAPINFSRDVPGPTRSYADILLHCGYDDPQHLLPLVQGWQSLLAVEEPDVVVFDYAPTAQLACLDRNHPQLLFGCGYYHPEPGCSPIDMCYWSGTEFAEGRVSEERVLKVVRSVISSSKVNDCRCLGDLLGANVHFMTHLPAYDLYRRHRASAHYLAPVINSGGLPAPCWRPGATKRIFAYLKADKPQVTTVLEGLSAGGYDVVCFLSGEGATKLQRFSSERLIICDQPLDLQGALSQADLVICHAGMGMISTALYNGCPLLLMPTQPEQIHNTLCTESLGVGLGLRRDQTPESVVALVNRLLNEPSYYERSRVVAHDYHALAPEDPIVCVADGVEALIA